DDCALAAPVLPQMAGGGGQRGGGSRGGNYILNPCRHDASRDAVYFAGDKALQPLEFALAWRIMPQEFIGESYRPQWQTHGVADLAASGYREFATATSQINHQCRRTIHAKIRDQSEMDQPRFFQPGNNLNSPAGRGSHPLEKCLRITSVAQRAGGDYADRVGYHLLCSAVKAAQHFNRFRHRLRREKARTEHPFT